jgi:hypothetical protein
VTTEARFSVGADVAFASGGTPHRGTVIGVSWDPDWREWRYDIDSPTWGRVKALQRRVMLPSEGEAMRRRREPRRARW